MDEPLESEFLLSFKLYRAFQSAFIFSDILSSVVTKDPDFGAHDVFVDSSLEDFSASPFS